MGYCPTVSSLMADPMRLLCLSNGHGEDTIALRILQALQQQPHLPKLAALPLVGEGHTFADSGIPLVGPVKQMPSGGFVYMDGRQFARDLRGGLLPLLGAQWRSVRAWAQAGGVILAVGDIVPLLFAWMSGAPYAFVGTAKSEYYLRDDAGLLPRPSRFEQLEGWSGSVYLPWDRWLMSRRRCRAVFPRDSLTSSVLQRWAIPTFDLGNPMMDGLEPLDLSEKAADAPLTFVLLPGSRVPEAYENWQRILQVVVGLVRGLRKRLLFLGAIDPHGDLDRFHLALTDAGWRLQDDQTYMLDDATLVLSQSSFGDFLHRADLAIAAAGTATEQFVGLGKPALLVPGNGPQFTPSFAEAQSRLLGPSAILLGDPAKAVGVVRSLLKDPDRLHLISENGRRRMGEPGAAGRIADRLIERLGG